MSTLTVKDLKKILSECNDEDLVVISTSSKIIDGQPSCNIFEIEYIMQSDLGDSVEELGTDKAMKSLVLCTYSRPGYHSQVSDNKNINYWNN